MKQESVGDLTLSPRFFKKETFENINCQSYKSVRTYEVFSEHVLSDVFKQRGEDGQQGEGSVVDDLSDASRLLSAVGELTELQVLLRLLQIFCCTVKV